MTVEIIVACIGLVASILGVYKWWLKTRSARATEDYYNEVVKHQKKVRLSIKDAEKIRTEGDKITEAILAGKLSDAELNRVRSGLPVKDSK